MSQSLPRFILIIALLVPAVMEVTGQTTMPDELNKNALKDQLNYLEVKTRIYENYRAIREDMFQKIKGNVLDSLSLTESRITGLSKSVSEANQKIDSLNTSLETTKSGLEEITRTKNSIKVLGIEVNKITYNTIMWTIVTGLAAFLAIGFLIMKRNMAVTSLAKKDLKELREEFEAYRKTTREAREKMSMDHFKELQRLKGGGK